jgi:hypothetical protein
MKLSKENYDKIVKGGLYRADYHKLPHRDDPYWCRNWIFRPEFYKDQIFMNDTYWSSGDCNSYFELTDENIDKFEFLFVEAEYKKVGYDEACWYNPKDVFRDVATDSGGYSCSSCIWVPKAAKYDKYRHIYFELPNSFKGDDWFLFTLQEYGEDVSMFDDWGNKTVNELNKLIQELKAKYWALIEKETENATHNR